MNQSKPSDLYPDGAYPGKNIGRILGMVSIFCSITYFTFPLSPIFPIFVLIGLGFGFAAVIFNAVQVFNKMPAKIPLIFGILGLLLTLLGMVYGISRHLKALSP
jgi:uncharacterized membrane protein HdeD (DUF308 family)